MAVTQSTTSPSALSFAQQMGYACGMLGYSILVNIISVMLIYVYLPPDNAGLVSLAPQIVFAGILNILSLVVASGRIFDAITDPMIAFFSDRSKHRQGRRIPFMKWSLLPCAVFCVLIFIPWRYEESTLNLWWLVLMQFGFYLSLSAYIVPYNALLPELAQSAEDRLSLSTILSFSFVVGIIFSSQTPLIAELFESIFQLPSTNRAIEYAVGFWAIIAAVFLLIPVFVIDEEKHCHGTAITISIKTALRQTLNNRNFLLFVIAETFYFTAITIVVSGLLYYLSVLLELPESLGGWVMASMVLCSLLVYPFMNKLVSRFGKKRLIVFSFVYLGFLIGAIFFMGKVAIDPHIQIFGFGILASIPLALLGILPFVLIAEMAANDAKQTGQQKEAMYFAIRNFANKFGQTLGVMVFAILTLFGKDPGNDFGIRLSGIIGFLLCMAAMGVVSAYREE